ncbi:Hsp70 family protein [Phytohabitans rumicis]|uniref:Uncharacterized protein n=1 Tax=Phytohabitans rumicis TaxID=1076125 RepID=A0A6V8LSE9_9ACTN|nr:Hsp70 family protein [Phytohabitans rumicis]GFJ95675.1 hypothetical protein Prum_093170 [Phytohabitans rumicis]
MTIGAYRLGVDFGTSTTVAVLAWPDGAVKPLVFDGSELLPSAVCVDGDGTLLVGRDALHAARARPEGFEPNPKRCVDDGAVLLGDVEVPVPELFAAVLRRVAVEARRVAGGPLASVTLTCPAGWGRRRRDVLTVAAGLAGLGTPALVAEPVAAASQFVDGAGHRVPVGSCAVVYDLGAGTFDAAVVRRTADGFEVVAEAGLFDAGGLDIDEAVVAYLGSVFVTRDADWWARLHHPATAEDRRAARLLRDDVRTGKEVLSRASSTLIRLPLFEDDAPLGREQLDLLARPILDRTLRTTRAVIDEAGIGTDAVAGLFLVGGSTRMPLVAALLHRSLGLVPTVIDRPELVVAEGSLRVPASADTDHADPVPVVAAGGSAIPEVRPASAEPAPAEPVDVERRPGNRRRRLLAAVVAALTVAALIVANEVRTREDGSGTLSPGPTASATASPTASATPAAPRRVGRLAGADWPVAFSRDGRTLATEGANYTVLLWDVTDPARPRRTATIKPNAASVNALDFSPDGRTLAIAGQATTASLWDVSDRARPVRTASLTGYTTGVYDLEFRPDGRTLATASLRVAVLWNVTDRTRPKRAAVLTDFTGAVSDVGFSQDGRLMATLDDAPSLMLWEFQDGKASPSRLATAATTGRSQALALSADKRTLATSNDDTVTFWDVRDHTRPAKLSTLPGGSVVDFSPDGDSLVTVSRYDVAQLWNIADPAKPVPRDTFDGDGARFGPDGILAVSAEDGVGLWTW